jgi:hypothetical protein
MDEPNVSAPTSSGGEHGTDVPDQLDDASRAAFHEALTESEQDVLAGRLVDAADVIRELRRR